MCVERPAIEVLDKHPLPTTGLKGRHYDEGRYRHPQSQPPKHVLRSKDSLSAIRMNMQNLQKVENSLVPEVLSLAFAPANVPTPMKSYCWAFRRAKCPSAPAEASAL